MTPAQCRAGRALINMNMAQLASVAVVPVTTIFDFEGGYGKPKAEDLDAIQGALEKPASSSSSEGCGRRKDPPEGKEPSFAQRPKLRIGNGRSFETRRGGVVLGTAPEVCVRG